MESATCCGMEWARSAVWNHHEVMYGINPKENTRWRVMPYAYGDSILTCGEITYQSFGLDKKRTKHPLRSFLYMGYEKDIFRGFAIRIRTPTGTGENEGAGINPLLNPNRKTSHLHRHPNPKEMQKGSKGIL